jgi:hypothetical protein
VEAGAAWFGGEWLSFLIGAVLDGGGVTGSRRQREHWNSIVNLTLLHFPGRCFGDVNVLFKWAPLEVLLVASTCDASPCALLAGRFALIALRSQVRSASPSNRATAIDTYLESLCFASDTACGIDVISDKIA